MSHKGGYAVVFCSSYQFGKWYESTSKLTEQIEEQDDLDLDMTKNVTRQIFSVEHKPLKFFRANGNFLSNPEGRRLTHMCMVVTAVHLWRNGLSASATLDLVNYTRGCHVLSSLPGWTDTIDNIPRLTADEKAYTTEVGDRNRPLMLRLEQKSEALLMTLEEKYSQPGDLVFDPFAWSLSTAWASMLLSKHRRCVISDNYPECCTFGMQQLVED